MSASYQAATTTRQLSAATVKSIDLWNVVAALLADGRLKSVSLYATPKLVVTATRRGRADKRDTRTEMVLTIGRPNYRGRRFVKACVKAGEPFPVRKLQLRWMKGKAPASW